MKSYWPSWTKHGQGAAGEELLDGFLSGWFPSAYAIRVDEGADRLVVIAPPYDWFVVDAKTGDSDLTCPQSALRREIGFDHYGIFRISERRFLLAAQQGQELIRPWKGQSWIKARDVITSLKLRTDEASVSLKRFRNHSDIL